jgi:hypothetical protein
VKDRTTAPPLFVVLTYAIVLFSLYTVWRDDNAANWGKAAFAAFNAVATVYAIVAHVGLRNSLVDVVMNIVQRLYVPVRPRQNRKAKRAKANDEQEQQLDRESTLCLGVAAQWEGREARRIRRTVVQPEQQGHGRPRDFTERGNRRSRRRGRRAGIRPEPLADPGSRTGVMAPLRLPGCRPPCPERTPA